MEYSGQILDGQMHGKGKLVYRNGESYEGDWIKGKRHGRGKYFYSDGSVYDGEWQSDVIIGHGVCHYADGNRYEGEWENGKVHGTGVLRLRNGDRYEGSWKEGMRNGYGVFYYHDGDKYEGEWKNDERNGHGTMYYYDEHGALNNEIQEKYEGSWLSGQIHGIGKYYYSDGSIYDGAWMHGKMHGKGVLLYSDGIRYEGGFANDMKEGFGVLQKINGEKYEGYWHENFVDGKGVLTYADGDKFFGEFKLGKKEGEGEQHFSNGDKFKGTWINDKACGFGVLESNNGDRYEGEWLNDRRHGKGKFFSKDTGVIFEGDWYNGFKHGRGALYFLNGDHYSGEWKEGRNIGNGQYFFHDSSPWNNPHFPIEKVNNLPPSSPESPSPSSTPLRYKGNRVFHPNDFNLIKYLEIEIFGISELRNDEPIAVQNIDNFLGVPLRLESFLLFGWFICVDSFLYVFTFLPVRVVFAILRLLVHLLASLFFVDQGSNKRRSYFHRTHMFDLMRGILFIWGIFVLQHFDISTVYHFIRGQTMIKLYVLTAMMDILDRLFGSFGQDALNSLFWKTRTCPEKYGQIVLSFLVVVVYVAFHCSLFFFQVTTLTVAINSSDQALITVVILNNFAEIKSYVFKKFDQSSVFSLACSDIIELFQLSLFLGVIALVGYLQGGTSPYSYGIIYLKFFIGETVADWTKHAFISKFNNIKADVYDDFSASLRDDILQYQNHKITLDPTHTIVSRLGISQIPLGCIFARFVILACASQNMQIYLTGISRQYQIFIAVGVFVSLVIVKLLVGLGLVIYAGYHHNKQLYVSKIAFPKED